MPYCCKCGKPVGEADVYCRGCGAQQAPQAPQLSSLSPRTAAVLCYIPFVGWVASIVVLASQKFRSDRMVRFHAFQGLYLFVAWLIVRWVVGWWLVRPLPLFIPGRHFHLDLILQLAIVGVWIFMLIKVSQNQDYSLPILGELAQKSVAES